MLDIFWHVYKKQEQKTYKLFFKSALFVVLNHRFNASLQPIVNFKLGHLQESGYNTMQYNTLRVLLP